MADDSVKIIFTGFPIKISHSDYKYPSPSNVLSGVVYGTVVFDQEYTGTAPSGGGLQIINGGPIHV